MSYVPLEKCLESSGGSIYKLSVMVAKRAQELAEGAKPLIETGLESKPIRLAMREVLAGQLKVDLGKSLKK